MYKKNQVVKANDGREYVIKNHIPNKDAYEMIEVCSGRFSVIHRSDIVGVISDVCPNCDTAWSITRSPFLNNEWRDCLKCKKTKEQIDKEITEKEKPESEEKKPSGTDHKQYSFGYPV